MAVQPIIIMPHSEITKSTVPDQLIFLEKAFRNAPIDDICKWIQPGIGEIETRCTHDDWQKRISYYKSTKSKSFISFIFIGFINFALIILCYDNS